MGKADPIDLAHQFLRLNANDFRMFWNIVAVALNEEDGDIEAQWDYCGQQMRATDVAVIGALYSAVASGQKSGRS